VIEVQKPKSQYQPQREYGIPIYIRREGTTQKKGIFGAGTQSQKTLEEIVMYI